MSDLAHQPRIALLLKELRLPTIKRTYQSIAKEVASAVDTSPRTCTHFSKRRSRTAVHAASNGA